ncbi:MAG: galactokinase [Candidatus Saliniplasma sp.]
MVKILSPGRVNLIGEHTDYTGGYVMPMAIDFYTVVEGWKNDSVDLFSYAYSERKQFEVDELVKEDDWVDHVKGVYSVLQEEGYSPGGMKTSFDGDLPIGSGLSASASFELGVMTLLDELYDLGLSGEEMALLCQRVENDYVGVSCGIMDQFVISMGEEGKVMMLDTDTLEFEFVDFPEELKVVVFHTGVERELRSSEYNERRSTVEDALDKLGVDNSKELTEGDLEGLSELERKRLGYIIRENERVIDTKEALEKGDLEEVGKILIEAHEDIAENYEASCEELDYLVERSVEKGALGARLTGAGWGGAAIALWKGEGAERFAEEVFDDYKHEYDHDNSDYFVVEPSDGVQVVE